MNRKYTTEEFKNVVNLLRKYIKDISITTDIIVGFPGETTEEFDKTYEYLKRIELSKMHIFKYSPRTGTRAEKMENQVDGNIKEERSKALIKLNEINEKKFIDKFIGEDMEVLYEQQCNNKEGYYEGYTPNYIKVISESKEDLSGKIVNTKLIETKDEYAVGKII